MKKIKFFSFLKILILCSFISYVNRCSLTYAKDIGPFTTYACNINKHNPKSYRLVNNTSIVNNNFNMNYDELIVVSCKKDLDGDNLKESIELIYNGDFILKIDDKHIIVEKNVYYCPRNILLCPNLEIIDELYDKYKIIIISYSKAIHQINPTVETWFYEYKNKEINQRDSPSSL